MSIAEYNDIINVLSIPNPGVGHTFGVFSLLAVSCLLKKTNPNLNIVYPGLFKGHCAQSALSKESCPMSRADPEGTTQGSQESFFQAAFQ